MRVLLVEDEYQITDALSIILKKNKMNVDIAHDGIEGQAFAESKIYDVIVLDRMLPKRDGLQVLIHLRQQGIRTPVLFLTAKDSISNRVEGLNAGADDYLVKPFASDELIARIRALGRRLEPLTPTSELHYNELHLSPLTCEMTYRNKSIKLTVTETQLLEFFIHNNSQVLTKTQILEKVWGFNNDVEINNVELYVYYLRKKLNQFKCPVSIQTVRGIGYILKEV